MNCRQKQKLNWCTALLRGHLRLSSFQNNVIGTLTCDMFSIASTLQPPTTMHINMHYTHNTTYPTACIYSPMHTLQRLREWESVGIRLSPLGNAGYVACLLLLCQGSKWLNGKSVWLVFRRCWVWIPAGSWIFFLWIYFSLSHQKHHSRFLLYTCIKLTIPW